MHPRYFHFKEAIERRYLGALQFVDNTTQNAVRRYLEVFAPDLELFLNRSQLHVISYAKGLEKHAAAFYEPPGQPPAESMTFSVTVRDPLGVYLPRILTVALPRKTGYQDPGSLFHPIDVPMYTAAAAPVSPNWSVIRAAIADLQSMDDPIPIPGALLRVTDESDDLLMAGLSDTRGEALIPIPGIPIAKFAGEDEPPPDDGDLLDHNEWVASGPVIEMETPVKLEVILAPRNGSGTLSWPVDPGLLEENRQNWHRKLKEKAQEPLKDHLTLKLRTGHTQTVNIWVEI